MGSRAQQKEAYVMNTTTSSYVYDPKDYSDLSLDKYRVMFKDEYERDTKLTDEQLTVLAMAHPVGDDEGVNDEAFLVLMKKAERHVADAVHGGAVKVNVAAAHAVHARAVEMANRIGVKINAIAEGLQDKKEDVDVGPLTLMFMLRRNDGFGTADDKTEGWPVVDSEPPEDLKDGKLSNTMYDWYETTENGKTVDRSFWTDMADATTYGKKIAEARAKISQNKTDPAFSGDRSVLDQDDKTWNTRRGALHTRYRKAAKLHFGFQAVKEMPLLLVTAAIEREPGTNKPVVDPDGDFIVRRTTVPITIYDNSNPPESTRTHWAPCTVGRFLKINWNVVGKAGGAYASVTAQLAKKPKSKDGWSPKSFDEFASAVPAILGWLDTRENHAALLSAFNDGKKNDVIESLGDLIVFLNVNIKGKLWTKYEALKAEQVAAAEAKAKAEKEAKVKAA